MFEKKFPKLFLIEIDVLKFIEIHELPFLNTDQAKTMRIHLFGMLNAH